MDKKTTDWVCYLTWIGWLVAYCSGDKEASKFHLNQSLVINIFSSGAALASAILIFIPILGLLVSWAANIFIFVCFIIGLVAAINEEEKEVPLIGQIKLLK